MEAIWAAVVGVAGTGLLSLVGAIVMGKLVPGSRVDKAELEAATWKRAYEDQAKLLERQQLTADITDKVMAAVRDQLSSSPTGSAS